MEDIAKLTETLEQHFLDHLLYILESETVELENARQITREFVELQPFSSFEHMRMKMKLFTEMYPLFEPVYKKMFSEPSDTTKKMLSFVEQLIKDKSPSEALKIISSA